MTTTEATRIAAGTWDIDPVHSDVSFAVRHMMVSKVRGRFGAVSGEIVTGEDLVDSSVTATIETASVDTGNDQRDAHVRSADFLDVEQFPTMAYRSTAVRRAGDEYVVDGELTLHGVTRPVALRLEPVGSGPDAYGGTRVGFSATATVNRNDFGVDIRLPLDGGGIVVGEKVEIQLEIEGVLRTG
jgi:polyisoprenoid-binding protein YceI